MAPKKARAPKPKKVVEKYVLSSDDEDEAPVKAVVVAVSGIREDTPDDASVAHSPSAGRRSPSSHSTSSKRRKPRKGAAAGAASGAIPSSSSSSDDEDTREAGGTVKDVAPPLPKPEKSDSDEDVELPIGLAGGEGGEGEDSSEGGSEDDTTLREKLNLAKAVMRASGLADSSAFYAAAKRAIDAAIKPDEIYDMISTYVLYAKETETVDDDKARDEYFETVASKGSVGGAATEHNAFNHVGVVFASPVFADVEQTVARETELIAVGPNRRSGFVRCPHCKQNNTYTIEKQTAGGDESITNIHTCYTCGITWSVRG